MNNEYNYDEYKEIVANKIENNKKSFWKKLFVKRNIIIFSIIAFVLIAVIIVILIIKANQKKVVNTTPSLKLYGLNEIEINVGENYVDPGYSATSKKNIDETDKVVVSGDVDVNKEGTYTITYTYDDIVVERHVVVKDKGLDDKKITLTLLGDSEITLTIGDKYQEPGYKAYDSNNNDLSSNVKVIGSCDTSKVGTYEITYQIIADNEKVEKIRKIQVKKKKTTKNNDKNNNKVDKTLNIKITKNNEKITNQNITLTIDVSGSTFSHIQNPDGTYSKNAKYTYIIKENGSYTFKAYNKDGNEFTKKIEITNIDKVTPTASCVATINQNNTIIKVSNQNKVIEKYIYYNNSNAINTTSLATLTYGSKLSQNIKVGLTDSAGNTNTIACQIIDNSYYEPILPNSDEKSYYSVETDTLKVYITKLNSYYITRIWVKDAYSQLNKYDSPEYGENLYKPGTLLEKANEEYKLQDKFLLGFNASGFYLKGSYDPDSVKEYSKYNKTSVGTLVITNGKVVRNAYDKAVKTWYIMGVDKNKKMRIFEDTATDNTESKKISNDNIINSGIKNTYTFAAPLIIDSKAANIKTSMPNPNNDSKLKLQTFCQVNDNNFILITANTAKRKDIINKLLSLNCQTAMNLDGGGSIALLYKEKNSSTIKTVVGNGRKLTEVGYFSE